jgi:protein SCO1/2
VEIFRKFRFWIGVLLGLQWLAASAHAQSDGIRGREYFPNSVVVSHEGRELRFFDDVLRDKTVLISFIYASCGNSCPLETARLKKVAALLCPRLGSDIHFFSITIDPENDTPEILRAYHSRYRLGPGWTLLTGKKADLLLIQKRLGLLSREQEAGNLQEHDLNVIAGNQKTGLWVRRSHLENAQVLAGLLEGLQKGPSATAYASDYRLARTRLERPTRGEELYFSRCIDCHSLGEGDGLGPDLAGITKRRPRAWLRRWLKEPDRMLQEGEPSLLALKARFNDVIMPNLKLGEADISALLNFLDQHPGAKE